jgi:hypothetical protein
MIGTIISDNVDGQAGYTDIAWDPAVTEDGVTFQQPALTKIPGIYGEHGHRVEVTIRVIPKEDQSKPKEESVR